MASTSRILSLFRRCLKDCVQDCDRICLSYLELAMEQCDLATIRDAMNLSLMRVDTKMHSKVWEPVLRFITDKVLLLTQLDSLQEEDEENIDEAELINILLTKGFAKIGFISEEIVDSKSIGDVWSAQILERYLRVAPQQRQHEILMILAKTRDNTTVNSVYKKYLIKDEDSGKYLSLIHI